MSTSKTMIRGGVTVLFLASLAMSYAYAAARGVLRCDSCMTVNDFSTTGKNWVLQKTNLNTPGLHRYRFAIFNITDKLLGEIVVTHYYDPEIGTSSTHALALTGTVSDMQQAYKVSIPDLGLTYIPSNIASSYTGSTQQQVIAPYLANYYSSSNSGQDTTTLAVFPDYSSAVYQLTDASNSEWTFVSNSGHDSAGNPLDDDAQPYTKTPPPGTILTPPVPVGGGSIAPRHTGGEYGVDIFGVSQWVDGVIDCMLNGCSHINGS